MQPCIVHVMYRLSFKSNSDRSSARDRIKHYVRSIMKQYPMFYVHQKYSLYILFSDERKVALIVLRLRGILWRCHKYFYASPKATVCKKKKLREIKTLVYSIRTVYSKTCSRFRPNVSSGHSTPNE